MGTVITDNIVTMSFSTRDTGKPYRMRFLVKGKEIGTFSDFIRDLNANNLIVRGLSYAAGTGTDTKNSDKPTI